MREQGVLDRCLLIYEEAIRRLRNKEGVTPEVFNQTAALIRSFVEEYHEQNKEKYIFPVFEHHKRLVDLVQTLFTRHKAGRDLTARVFRLSTPDQFRLQENRTQLMTP
jgi:hemerythrin-like domain-containing protein